MMQSQDMTSKVVVKVKKKKKQVLRVEERRSRMHSIC